MFNPILFTRLKKARWWGRIAHPVALMTVLGPFVLEIISFLQGRKILRAIDPVFAVPFSTSVALLMCLEAAVICCLIVSKIWLKSLSLVTLGATLAAYNILFYYYGGPHKICPCFGSFFDLVPFLAKHRAILKLLYIGLLFAVARILIMTEHSTLNQTYDDLGKSENNHSY